MKNNEVFSTNIKNDFKFKSLIKIAHKSPNNFTKFNPLEQKRKTIKQLKKRNLDNSFKKHKNNLNSFSIESNAFQKFSNNGDVSNNNYIHINNYTQMKNAPFPLNKTNKAQISNKKDDKIKQVVNLSKNIEEIIKRRNIDKKIDKKKKKKKFLDKKKIFASGRAITSKDLKKTSSINKKGIAVNKNNILSKNTNIKKENDINKKEEEERINKKYYETKMQSLSFEKDNNGEENLENEEDNNKIYNISNLNSNTEEVCNERYYRFYDNSNTFRVVNYDYDSCIEDDLKSQKEVFIKSQSKSKDTTIDHNNNNYTYDTINKELISDFEEKHKSSKKDINNVNDIKVENNINNKEIMIDEKESEKETNKDNIQELEKKENNIKNENKGINANLNNNSSINSNDLSTNTNINLTENICNNSEKHNLSNNSIPKINSQRQEVENINKIISTAVKNINSNLNLNINNLNVKGKLDANNDKESNISSNINQKVEKNENSSLNPCDSKFSSSNKTNIKQNIYAPKKIKKFTLKNENNINNNKIINEKVEKQDFKSQRIAYSKKLAPSIIYFQRHNNISSSYKNETENNRTEIKEIKYIKNRTTFGKLNSSFEAKNLQMNNIFMNNNIYNNNFNCPYRDSNTYINTEVSNNCFYNLNSNSEKLIYEINNPSNQGFFQMNNNNHVLNNSFNNSKNNYILPINNEIIFKGNDEINNISKNEELLNSIDFEDFIILDRKIINIKNTLSKKDLIVNECFEYLNYYYNSSIYNNIDNLFINNKFDTNNLKICLGYKLLSIMICYNCSLDINIFEQTHLLLKEILDLNYSNLILLYEYILDNIISYSSISINNNLWLLKLKNIINKYKSEEDKNNYNEYISLNKNTEMTPLEKVKINTNFIMNNINIIITNIKSKNNEYLIALFKSMNEQIFKNMFFYFFNYILNIINFKGSIIGNTIIQNHLLNNINTIVPYIKTKNIKKYSLVLDLEETLLHFIMNINNNNEGIVDIRPGTTTFLDNISEYYELIVFNEGEQKYTDLLIDSLEENKIYFEHRFYRDHVIIDNNDVVKDLNRIGRSLDKILIIDNMPQNFKFHKNNAILIKSFWGENQNDHILEELTTILIKIAKDGGDIRNGISKYKNEIVEKITIGNNNI